MAYIAVRGFLILRAQRGYQDFVHSASRFAAGSPRMLTPWPNRSPSRLLRSPLRVPPARLVPALLPLLPHATPTLPSPLLPRPLLRREFSHSRPPVDPRLTTAWSCQVLLSACIFDLGTSMFKPRFRLQIAAVVLTIAVSNWWYFSPLTYAGVWTRGQCESAKWMKNWDFSWYALPLSLPSLAS